jgi:Uri superfamily endonuclease
VSPTSPNSGVYLVLLRLTRPAAIRVGALGRCHLPAGWYVYAGSAQRALRARVARHLRRRKPVHWHIDRLTTHRHVVRLGAVLLLGRASECDAGRVAQALIDGVAPVPGFGASDCRRGCAAHLWWTGSKRAFDRLARHNDPSWVRYTVTARSELRGQPKTAGAGRD